MYVSPDDFSLARVSHMAMPNIKGQMQAHLIPGVVLEIFGK